VVPVLIRSPVSELKRPRHMRLISLMVLTGWLWAAPVLAGDSLPPPCLMQPAHQFMRLPDRGFTWLRGEGFRGTCDEVPTEGWSRGSSGTLDLFVHADGPAGSGRFWKVTVGVARKPSSKPIRGVCVSTSTVGWRVLQRYSKGALPWLDDVDGDGSAEFILWDSFPLHDEASMAEYALVAWVYRLVAPDSLVIDWNLSRGLARSLAKEYRSPLEATPGYPGDLRAQAAEALERFANGQCSVPHTEAR
jgi:hypothetical protein